MSRYIRCCYCGCMLGATDELEEVPSNAYCVSCFAERKNEPLEEQIQEEILKEWER